MPDANGLFTSQGQPRFGVYGGELWDLNLAGYSGLADRLKRFRAKRWRFVGIVNPQVVAGVAVVDTGYMGTTFAYAFDLARRKLIEFKGISPLGRQVSFSNRLDRGEVMFDSGGNRVRNQYVLGASLSLVDVLAATKNGMLEIRCEVDENPEATRPHQIVGPTPKGSFIFTHKTAGLPAQGHVVIGDRRYVLDPSETFAAVDHTVGYHDYNWEWRWASLGGLSADGRRVGLNLVNPIHHPTWNENAIWLDGRCYPAGAAEFRFNKSNVLEPWEITTQNGDVNLTFEPLGERAETINAGIIKSAFHQPIGYYSGSIGCDGGTVTLERVLGVAEDHKARW
jgi:hypothetical protein